MSTTATVDEYDVVSVYADGKLSMFMHRSDYVTIRKSLGLPPLEPDAVTSGGGILYGIPCTKRPHAK